MDYESIRIAGYPLWSTRPIWRLEGSNPFPSEIALKKLDGAC
jgi:hypothetical protein